MSFATESTEALQFFQRPLKTFPEENPLSELDPVIQSILIHRGVQGVDDCDADLAKLLPFTLFKDIDVACDILFDALNLQKHVLIVGDFDADGATSTTIALKGLRLMGFESVDYLVPDRFKFGYGLSPAIVDVAFKRGAELIVTVDNGISSIEGVAKARELGMDVLVTDHHLPGRELPNANAIVNPNQPGCRFPSKNLAGVGVMFYLLIALRAFLRDKNHFDQAREPNLANLLDIVALGTVVDLVALDSNNRRLVQQGLARIRAGYACPGIKALIEVAKRSEQSFKSTDFAFALGPRINAAGRLDSMSLGIECLLSDSMDEARAMAAALNDFNEERKNIETGMKTEALALIPELLRDVRKQNLICLFDERWHQGVVGIVASRLKEDYHLPSVIFAQDDQDPESIKGSARSVPGLHMRDVLDRVASQHPGLLSKFGGHAMAAGMSIAKAHFSAFREALIEEVDNALGEHKEDILQAKLFLDPPLSHQHFTIDFAKLLQGFEPWGQHFPEPVFLGEFYIEHQRVLSDKHLKMMVRAEGMAQAIDAIAFNVPAELWVYQGSRVNLVYRLDINMFRGMQSLQLMVEKIIPLDV